MAQGKPGPRQWGEQHKYLKEREEGEGGTAAGAGKGLRSARSVTKPPPPAPVITPSTKQWLDNQARRQAVRERFEGRPKPTAPKVVAEEEPVSTPRKPRTPKMTSRH